MTAAEQGLLLLCCPLGDGLKPLTAGQFELLAARMRKLGRPEDPDRDLTWSDLYALGCSEALAGQILRLLDRGALLERQLRRWQSEGVRVATWLDRDYPAKLRQRLGDDAPPVLFLLGDRSLLNRDAIALVGSRDLTPQGRQYAGEVGRLAAETGYLLVSGHARGADQTAEEACLAAGGSVVSVVADRLLDHRPRERVLYVSEDGPGAGFSAARALRRNRLIHSLGRWTFVAQVRYGRGGTWDGSVHNLHGRWSPLFVPEDGSPGAMALAAMGATPISLSQLRTLTPNGSSDE